MTSNKVCPAFQAMETFFNSPMWNLKLNWGLFLFYKTSPFRAWHGSSWETQVEGGLIAQLPLSIQAKITINIQWAVCAISFLHQPQAHRAVHIVVSPPSLPSDLPAFCLVLSLIVAPDPSENLRCTSLFSNIIWLLRTNSLTSNFLITRTLMFIISGEKLLKFWKNTLTIVY